MREFFASYEQLRSCEKRLKAEMKIPVMHDDQHGTAIISSAALLNALELQDKKIDKARFVVNGAGAAAIACVELYIALGAKTENFLMSPTPCIQLNPGGHGMWVLIPSSAHAWPANSSWNGAAV